MYLLEQRLLLFFLKEVEISDPEIHPDRSHAKNVRLLERRNFAEECLGYILMVRSVHLN